VEGGKRKQKVIKNWYSTEHGFAGRTRKEICEKKKGLERRHEQAVI